MENVRICDQGCVGSSEDEGMARFMVLCIHGGRVVWAVSDRRGVDVR